MRSKWSHWLHARPGEIYLYRTRKPSGRSILRHNGYVGKTYNPRMRDIEHLHGGGRYGSEPKVWADLDPKRHIVWSSKKVRPWRLALMENVAFYFLWPVYNQKGNKWNPRRISTKKQAVQRRYRDRGFGPVAAIRPVHAITTLIPFAGLVIILGKVYL